MLRQHDGLCWHSPAREAVCCLLYSLLAEEKREYFRICLQNETSDLIYHFSCIPGFSLSARIIVSAIINTHLICIKI